LASSFATSHCIASVASMSSATEAAAKPRKYIRFEVIDMNGKALSKTVPERHRKQPVFMYGGAVASGANAEVLTFPEEINDAGCPNYGLVPDWSTEQTLPWAAQPGVEVSRVYCEMLAGMKKGAPKNDAVPRTVCKRLMEELRAFEGKGYELLAGGELEFTVVKKNKDDQWVPLFDGIDIFATLQNSKAMSYCYDLERDMETVGVDVLTMNAEYGEGQLEIVFAPQFGVAGADSQATFRTGAKEIAQNRGYLATFMSRPFGIEGVGNGGHFNFSLWAPGGKDGEGEDVVSKATKGKTNVLHSGEDPDGLSATARHFLAGILAHANALEAICATTPPCYTRHGNWAPTMNDWGIDNRNAAVRVKADKEGNPGSCYMELRMPSASANGYLVMAGLAAAGMDGLARKLELGPQIGAKDSPAKELPKDLESALKALEEDTYMVEKLGKDFVRWYTGVKRGELAHLEAMASKVEGEMTADKVSAAWQHMFMEYL